MTATLDSFQPYNDGFYAQWTLTAVGDVSDPVCIGAHEAVQTIALLGRISGAATTYTYEVQGSPDGVNWFSLQTGAHNSVPSSMISRNAPYTCYRVTWLTANNTGTLYLGWRVGR